MNAKTLVFGIAVTAAGLNNGIAQRNLPVPPALESQLKHFFADKQAQARVLAREEQKEQMPEVWEFFSAGQEGEWARVAGIYRQLRRGAYQYENTKADPRLETMVWQPINEGYGAYEQCANMEEKYVTLFAREILDAMPRGSVYFGGTDPGRWIPTAFSPSHAKADPVFTITQNALADGLYLKYVRTMYGGWIATPTDDDSKRAFKEYSDDAELRLKAGRLKPGENVKLDINNKVQVSGQVSVMAINALIAKQIFDRNPRKEFFVEESFPLDWMYPYLTPHGLIMKLNRDPLERIPDTVLQKDQAYWTRLVDGALDKWLTPTTSVEMVCDFAQRVFDEREADPFKPDEKFVNNDYASKTYSKLRSSIAGVYAWRANNTKSPEEKLRMERAADFAFRQAFALCPYSPEAVYRYVSLLNQQNRKKEALLVAETALNLGRGGNFGTLVRELRKME